MDPADLLPRVAQLSNVLNRGRLFDRAIAATGISLERPAMTLLSVLNLADGPLRIGEIALRMQVAGPHATRHVQGLEQRGLVHRVADPQDQRARLIALTPEGKTAIDGYTRVVLGWINDALADWSQQDRQELGRLLGRMVDDLSSHLAAADRDEPPS